MDVYRTFVVIVVLFLGAPTLESIGTQATSHTPECHTACEAAGRTDPGSIRPLINNGANLCGCVCNQTTGEGLLHVSVPSICGVCINLLTSPPSNCACDDRDTDGNTPLHTAARICRLEIVDDLIREGCDVNAQNNDDDTPLCLASRRPDDNNCGQVVRSLLAAGAEPCTPCSDGETACEGCVFDNTCNVLDQDGACSCDPPLSSPVGPADDAP